MTKQVFNISVQIFTCLTRSTEKDILLTNITFENCVFRRIRNQIAAHAQNGARCPSTTKVCTWIIFPAVILCNQNLSHNCLSRFVTLCLTIKQHEYMETRRAWTWRILVPRAFDPSGLRQESRFSSGVALGTERQSWKTTAHVTNSRGKTGKHITKMAEFLKTWEAPKEFTSDKT